jgi:hypothetical protein
MAENLTDTLLASAASTHANADSLTYSVGCVPHPLRSA